MFTICRIWVSMPISRVAGEGCRIRFTSAAELVDEVAEAVDGKRLAKTVARYGCFDLFCMGGLGYMELVCLRITGVFQTGRSVRIRASTCDPQALSGLRCSLTSAPTTRPPKGYPTRDRGTPAHPTRPPGPALAVEKRP